MQIIHAFTIYYWLSEREFCSNYIKYVHGIAIFVEGNNLEKKGTWSFTTMPGGTDGWIPLRSSNVVSWLSREFLHGFHPDLFDQAFHEIQPIEEP